MKKNTSLNFALMVFATVVCLMSFVFEADAQQRRRRPTRRAAAPASTTPAASSQDIKDGAKKVSTQIKNVSKFLYILGGLAKDIEALDADIKARRTTRQTAIDQNEKAKQAVVESIRNLRAGLTELENEFRTKPALRLYAPWTDGIAGMTEQAEIQASGGQMTESGKTLLMVVEKLTDSLAALP